MRLAPSNLMPSRHVRPWRSNFSSSIHLLVAMTVVTAGLLLGDTAYGTVDKTWDGGGVANDNWSTAENWVDDSAPVDSGASAALDVVLTFGGTIRLTPNLDAGMTVSNGGFNTSSLSFANSAGAFTLTEPSVRGLDMLGDRSGSAGPAANIVNNSTALQTINLRIIVRGDLTGGTTFNTASGDISVTQPITSSAGGTVTKSGANTLFFSAGNAYTGPTTVSGGTLTVSIGGRLGSATSTGLVQVQNTAITLSISTGVSNAISDLATLRLDGGGTASVADVGYLTLGAGVNETVAALSLNGTLQAAGTYGSTGSSATFQSNEYFSGTGIVTVVPEPGSLGLLVCGLALAGMRRCRGRTSLERLTPLGDVVSFPTNGSPKRNF